MADKGVLLAGGKVARVLEVTTLIDGVPTLVEMQVLVLTDSEGNVIQSFADHHFQAALVDKLDRIERLLAMIANVSPAAL